MIYDPTESDHQKVDGVEREFSVGIGKAAEHQFCVGDEITGECVPVADDRLKRHKINIYRF